MTHPRDDELELAKLRAEEETWEDEQDREDREKEFAGLVPKRLSSPSRANWDPEAA